MANTAIPLEAGPQFKEVPSYHFTIGELVTALRNIPSGISLSKSEGSFSVISSIFNHVATINERLNPGSGVVRLNLSSVRSALQFIARNAERFGLAEKLNITDLGEQVANLDSIVLVYGGKSLADLFDSNAQKGEAMRGVAANISGAEGREVVFTNHATERHQEAIWEKLSPVVASYIKGAEAKYAGSLITSLITVNGEVVQTSAEAEVRIDHTVLKRSLFELILRLIAPNVNFKKGANSEETDELAEAIADWDTGVLKSSALFAKSAFGSIEYILRQKDTAEGQETVAAFWRVYQRILDAEEAASDEDKGMITHLRSITKDVEGEQVRELSDSEVMANIMILVTAAVDTIISNITVLLENLTLNPQLFQDMKTASPTERRKLIHDCIYESARIAGSPTFLKREVPKDEDAITINDHILPPGTSMLTFPTYALNDPNYFESPDEFIPGRDDPEQRSRTLPWAGPGRRECSGKGYAIIVITTIIEHLAENFDSLAMLRNDGIDSSTATPFRDILIAALQQVNEG